MRRTKGFTLIELMIVVAIIGILAAIGIPRFANLLEKSREGATKGNLNAIRSAISIYYSEKEGIWPQDFTTAFSTYMYPIPVARATPLGNVSDTTGVSAPPQAGVGVGWAYVTNNTANVLGTIYCNSVGTDSTAKSFTTY